MTGKYLNIINLGFALFIFSTCQAQTSKDSANQKIIQEIQQSHIDGNIPDKDKFDSLLKRDLEKYFSTSYGPITVKWEFLRDGPTQSGASYPKYYLWTEINSEQKLVSEGAVRVAAIDKTRFDITNYVDINQIKDKNVDIYSIFPRAVCEKIENRLK